MPTVKRKKHPKPIIRGKLVALTKLATGKKGSATRKIIGANNIERDGKTTEHVLHATKGYRVHRAAQAYAYSLPCPQGCIFGPLAGMNRRKHGTSYQTDETLQ